MKKIKFSNIYNTQTTWSLKMSLGFLQSYQNAYQMQFMVKWSYIISLVKKCARYWGLKYGVLHAQVILLIFGIRSFKLDLFYMKEVHVPSFPTSYGCTFVMCTKYLFERIDLNLKYYLQIFTKLTKWLFNPYLCLLVFLKSLGLSLNPKQGI
jgi:hypothetical protein